MIYSVIMHLSRVVCLLLVVSTGLTGVAFANHDGSHGSHCMASNQEEASASHQHSADHQEVAASSEGDEQSCIQHSCVAVFASMSIAARFQRLASGIVTLRGDLLRASISAESLHRPPIA